MKIKKKMENLLLVLIVFIMVLFISDIYKHYEKYDTVARYHLMLDLEKGDKEALEYYKDNYINEDIYLYDGNISFKLFAEKYNLSEEEKETIYKEYKASDLSLNKFVKEYKARD